MANTWGLAPLTVVDVETEFLSFAEREYPEGISETFLADSPLKWGTAGEAGTLVEWVNKADALIAAWALNAGQNNAVAAAVKTKAVLALNKFSIEANLRTTGEVDRALVQADLGTNYDLLKGATNWYVAATTVAPVALVSDFNSGLNRSQLPNVATTGAQVGDINPRVLFRLQAGASYWY